jgi:hypothetical protein
MESGSYRLYRRLPVPYLFGSHAELLQEGTASSCGSTITLQRNTSRGRNDMIDFLSEMSATTWIAVYGAVISTLAIYLNFRRIYLDRGSLKLTAMVARRTDDPSGRCYLSFKITNIGRRPIQVEGLASKRKLIGKKHAVMICRNIPKMLSEGETVLEMFDNFRFISDEPWSIFVWDSAGKNYRMRRRHLKSLYRSYQDYMQRKQHN